MRPTAPRFRGLDGWLPYSAIAGEAHDRAVGQANREAGAIGEGRHASGRERHAAHTLVRRIGKPYGRSFLGDRYGIALRRYGETREPVVRNLFPRLERDAVGLGAVARPTAQGRCSIRAVTIRLPLPATATSGPPSGGSAVLHARPRSSVITPSSSAPRAATVAPSADTATKPRPSRTPDWTRRMNFPSLVKRSTQPPRSAATITSSFAPAAAAPRL